MLYAKVVPFTGWRRTSFMVFDVSSILLVLNCVLFFFFSSEEVIS